MPSQVVTNDSVLAKTSLQTAVYKRRERLLAAGKINSELKLFTLPSSWNLVITTVVFVWTARHIRIFLDNQGLPIGMTRSMLVLTLASLLSWGSGEAVDWTEAKIQGKPQAISKSPDDISQLLDALNQAQVSAETKE